MKTPQLPKYLFVCWDMGEGDVVFIPADTAKEATQIVKENYGITIRKFEKFNLMDRSPIYFDPYSIFR